MARDDVNSVGHTRIIIPPSTVVGVTCLPFSNSVSIQQVSGSVLEIGGSNLASGEGYPIPGQFSFNCSGTFYLVATGATSVAALLFGFNGQA